MQAFKVLAHWDEEAAVWWAESDDIMGLVAEADTLEGLLDDLRHTIPDLLKANHGATSAEPIELHLLADRIEGIRVAA